MKYLIELKNDLIQHFDDLTPDKVTLQLVNGEIAKNSYTVQYIARFTLQDCRLASPFDVLMFIKSWFKSQQKDEPDLNFDCEVIDLESYDLQIDLALFDKLLVKKDGTTEVCLPPVWSDTADTFVSGAIAKPPKPKKPIK